VATLLADLKTASPQGLLESKRLANRSVREAIERHGEEMVELSARLFASEEAHEGMTAFLERRPPRWSA
jgi:enoyl-CoA hydratase